MRKNRAFTLIELLIVVAIIAILAAIAVPNFLEAQTRAKISRAMADQRAVATGMETYHIDNNTYPRCNVHMAPFARIGTDTPTLERLSTPIAYMTGEGSFMDPFRTKGIMKNGPTLDTSLSADEQWAAQFYYYTARNATAGGNSRWRDKKEPNPKWWLLESAGPDGIKNYSWIYLNGAGTAENDVAKAFLSRILYDSTNGTVSEGSIWRVGGTPVGRGKLFYKLAMESLN